MALNVVISDDVARKLITEKNSKSRKLFRLLKEKNVNIWLPVFSALDLEEEIEGEKRCPFFEEFSSSVKILSSIAAHWRKIPPDCPDKKLVLTAVASRGLPGETIIWTEKQIVLPKDLDMPAGNGDYLKKWIEKPRQDIPFVDLAAQQLTMREEIERDIFSVLSHGRYVLGSEIEKLESKLRAFVGAKHVLACSSGTDALLMVLMAWNIGPGDAVFTTPFTFVATAEVIALVGATPVFVDIDPETFNMDPGKLEKAIKAVSEKGDLLPRAIIPVDLFGLPCDYDAIEDIGKRWNLKVLQDAAQSFGAEYHGRKAGTMGNAAATSFFPAKPLGCYGDGGAVFTGDDDLAHRIDSIRIHGQGESQYDNVRIGLNARMDTLQAAILLTKLRYFPEELKKRQKVASTYSELLADCVRVPIVPDGMKSAWAQYSILLQDGNERTELIRLLKKEGIPSAVYYPKPLHLQRAFSDLGYRKGDFPVSEDISARILSLPMHPYLGDQAVFIAKKVSRALKDIRES